MNSPAWYAKVPLLIERGLTVPQIARDLGVSKGAVRQACYRRGWAPVKGRCGQPRQVTQDWQAKVLPMIEKGMTMPQIAHDLGVPWKLVNGLIRRRGWQPVMCPKGRRTRLSMEHFYDNDLADFDDGILSP